MDRDVIPAPHADRQEVVGEAVAALVELTVRSPVSAGDNGCTVRRCDSDLFEKVGQIEGARHQPFDRVSAPLMKPSIMSVKPY